MSSDEYETRESPEELRIEPEAQEEVSADAGELDPEEPVQEVEEGASENVLLSEIRETLVEEGKSTPKQGRGLRGWLAGLFKRREKPQPVAPVNEERLAQVSPEATEEEPEMMGGFAVYRVPEPDYNEFYPLDSDEDEPDLASQADEELLDPAGEASPEAEPPAEADLDLPTHPEGTVGEATHEPPQAADEENSDWRSFLTRFIKTVDKEETEAQLADEDVQNRLQRSMGADTAGGVESWLNSLREQEGESEVPQAPPQFSRDWLEDEERAAPVTADEELEPPMGEEPPIAAEISAEDLNRLRNQIFFEDEPAADGSDASAAEKTEDEPEVPVEDRLQDFHEAFAEFVRAENTPQDEILPDNEAEINLPTFSEEHPEIFEPGEEEIPSSEAELRTIALEDYEAPPSTGEVIQPEQPDTALERFAGWISDRSKTERFLLYSAMFVGFVAIVLLSAMTLQNLFPALRRAPQAAAAVVAPANGAPYPLRLVMTGGWPFDLGRGRVQNGKWDPQTNEWLEGTELRRVVGLRYNAQLEAVAHSLKKGDEISLIFSNADTIFYKVDEVKSVATNDTSVFTGTRPSLVIVLFDQNSSQRLVIVCGQ